MRNSNAKSWILCVVGTSMIFSGCASFTSDNKSKKKDKSWFSFAKKEYQVPQAMNVTWAYDILTLPGKPATRGFGGRIYFYNEKTQAIPVEGELMVYGFDDTNGVAETSDLNAATKRFKFTAEQLTTHFSEGQLGASYSVWIPWDAVPGNEKKIMLIPTFVAKDGRMVRGAVATVNLPGKAKSSEPTTILQVGAQTPLQSSTTYGQNAQAVANMAQPKPGVTTINMPHRLATVQNKSPELVAAFERMQATENAHREKIFNEFESTYSSQSYPFNAAPPTSLASYQTAVNMTPTESAFGTPSQAQMTQANVAGRQPQANVQQTANAQQLPLLAPPVLNVPSLRFEPNSHPAPASQSSQQGVYLTR